MKKTSIKTLYRLFAFLSDKTNGFAPFVKYKLTLGAVLIGLGACSNQNKKSVENNNIPNVTSEITDTTAVFTNDSGKGENHDSVTVSCYLTINVDDAMTDVKNNGSYILAESDENTIHTVVDDWPEYPGGDTAQMRFLNENIKYPIAAKENGIQGRVICNFVVERDGSITNVLITRGVDPSLDKEALRVIRSMPKWAPGKIDGKPVRARFTLPVTFKITK